jgi:CsoR family transcriptional regulator, copper-sensing transcriptional repressor
MAATPKDAIGVVEQHIAGEEAAKILNRLARIEGQVRGLQRMIEEGKDCEQVLAQLAAVKSALDRVGTHLIGYRMKQCLEEQTGVALESAAFEKAFAVFFKYVQCMSFAANQAAE